MSDRLGLVPRRTEDSIDRRRISPDVVRMAFEEAVDESLEAGQPAVSLHGIRAPAAGTSEARRLRAIYQRTGHWVRAREMGRGP